MPLDRSRAWPDRLRHRHVPLEPRQYLAVELRRFFTALSLSFACNRSGMFLSVNVSTAFCCETEMEPFKRTHRPICRRRAAPIRAAAERRSNSGPKPVDGYAPFLIGLTTSESGLLADGGLPPSPL